MPDQHADQQAPNNFCLNFDPNAGALVEGKAPDFSVSIQDSTATNTGDVPTAVMLQSLSARSGEGTRLRLALGATVFLGAAPLAVLGLGIWRRLNP